jgi:hypothetical protein
MEWKYVIGGYVIGAVLMCLVLIGYYPACKKYSVNRVVASILLWPYGMTMVLIRGLKEISLDIVEATNPGIAGRKTKLQFPPAEKPPFQGD